MAPPSNPTVSCSDRNDLAENWRKSCPRLIFVHDFQVTDLWNHDLSILGMFFSFFFFVSESTYATSYGREISGRQDESVSIPCEHFNLNARSEKLPAVSTAIR